MSFGDVLGEKERRRARLAESTGPYRSVFARLLIGESVCGGENKVSSRPVMNFAFRLVEILAVIEWRTVKFSGILNMTSRKDSALWNSMMIALFFNCLKASFSFCHLGSEKHSSFVTE